MKNLAAQQQNMMRSSSKTQKKTLRAVLLSHHMGSTPAVSYKPKFIKYILSDTRRCTINVRPCWRTDCIKGMFVHLHPRSRPSLSEKFVRDGYRMSMRWRMVFPLLFILLLRKTGFFPSFLIPPFSSSLLPVHSLATATLGSINLSHPKQDGTRIRTRSYLIHLKRSQVSQPVLSLSTVAWSFRCVYVTNISDTHNMCLFFFHHPRFCTCSHQFNWSSRQQFTSKHQLSNPDRLRCFHSSSIQFKF